MSDGMQVGPAPSTLARVAADLTASRSRMDTAATDIEALAEALCGPGDPRATSDQAGPLPAGSVNVLDILASGLSTPAARIEAATARIRAAIG